ncbi:MAG: type II toxin-antitoxin system VapC family toxin [Caulobacter sp.]|nr:type II toxin-antitoxin system VapC family toxin [Caulobacter sp.]
MRLLLDTHVLIWAARDPGRLSERVRDLLQDPGNDLFVSVVAAYEIEFKRDRDPDVSALPAQLTPILQQMDMEWLLLTNRHAALAGKLPRIHGDPFDRFIIAQAKIEEAGLVTKDAKIAAYGIPTIW